MSKKEDKTPFGPTLLRETENYRIVAVPYKDNASQRWLKQLRIEKRSKNSLEEPYFSMVDYDTHPEGDYSGPYYNNVLWGLLQEMFGTLK